nr:hypothetical protein [Xanthomonadaceae bacterium]
MDDSLEGWGYKASVRALRGGDGPRWARCGGAGVGGAGAHGRLATDCGQVWRGAGRRRLPRRQDRQRGRQWTAGREGQQRAQEDPQGVEL